MLICPNGHHNPADQQLCQVCDALIVPTSAENTRSARRRLVVLVTSAGAILLAVVVAGVVAVDIANGAVDKQLDPKLIEDACQRMEDTADVKLRARLPSPDQDLTAELGAAIQDIHAAAHMCLSVIAGSMNSYGGEFASDLQQGDKHLDAALAIINKSQPQI